MKLTKEQILEKISEKEIFDHFLKPFHDGTVLKPGQNISNPLLPEKQKTPSFNIYERNGKWKFKDFSTDDRGNCWQLIMLLKNISFEEALDLVSIELLSIQKTNPIMKELNNTNKNPLIFHRPFNFKEIEYWQGFGISVETLRLFNVKAFTNYLAYNKEGKEYEVKNQNNELMFSYYYGHNGHAGPSFKIYKPFDKSHRFIYLGSKDPHFIFGLLQLPKNGNYVFITGGEKDVMTLHAHGYSAICMNSETAVVPEYLISDFKDRFEKVLVLYDNDETGRVQSKKIAKQYNLHQLILPEIPNYGKDISDYFLNGRTKSDFDKLIENSIELANIANSTNGSICDDDFAEFVDFANFANSSEYDTQDNSINQNDLILLNTPTIPNEVYDQLPKLLKECCSVFKLSRQKDVFLTSALGILSGCLPNIHGIYGGKMVFANLYTFILAPSANGKGTMDSAQDLGKKYHRILLEKSEEAKKAFNIEFENYQKSKANNIETERPEKPKFELLYIPANSSSSKIYHHLNENNGKGIICETEADTLGNMFKKDWSSYSDLLRKGFHHERITQSRIRENQYMEIDESKISVVLSGTPNQIFNIISNAEDGLFSRFIFYIYQSEQKWISQRPDLSDLNLNDFFEKRSDEVFEMVHFFQLQPTIFKLNKDQWDETDELFGEYLERIVQISGKESESVVKRMGLIFYRICMILTAVRCFDARFQSSIIDCNQNDFNIAKKLIEIYLEHSLIMFENLPKSSKHTITKRPSKIEDLFAALPSSFKRQEAVNRASEFGLSAKTIDNFLRDEKGKTLHSPKAGEYEKL